MPVRDCLNSVCFRVSAASDALKKCLEGVRV